MAIDAAKVRELREKTGLPVMDCKKALETSNGDIDQAIESLRKAGANAQAKLAGRKAKEGRVIFSRSPDGRQGALVALRCETEPVANNELFRSLADQLAEILLRESPASADDFLQSALPAGGTVSGGLTELVNQLRENISLGAFARLEGDAVASYVHFDNKKAAIVALEGGSASDDKVEEIGKDLCMHVVFHRPLCLTRDEVDPQVVAKEREIRLAAARSDPKNAKKPDNIIEKIVEGQINKFVKEQCFLEQPFIRDEKISVESLLKQSGTGLAISGFAYVATDV
jgi:elongation factor Ts